MRTARINGYLVALFVELMGVLLFYANTKSLFTFYGGLAASTFLMVVPFLILVFWGDAVSLNRQVSVMLLFVPLVFVNYLYYSQMRVPVGFTDVHANLHVFAGLFSQTGQIQFGTVEEPSFAFVGLYVLLRFLSQMTAETPIVLSSIIPPLVNVFVALAVYVLVNRIHSHPVALLSSFLYGWENQVIVFGQELRTQTAGTLLLFLVVALALPTWRNASRERLGSQALLICLLLGIVVASFVSIFFALISLMGILAAKVLAPRLLGESGISVLLKPSTVVVFIACFFFYLLYVGVGFDRLVQTLAGLYESLLSPAGPAAPGYSGPPLYGTFVVWFTRLVWVVFAIFCLFYIRQVFSGHLVRRLAFLSGFGALLIFWLIDIAIGPLSSSRVYIVGFVLIAVVVADGLLTLSRAESSKQRTKLFRAGIVAFFCLFALASVASSPVYIVGSTSPLRPSEPIDTVFYWDANVPQDSMATFLQSFARHQVVYPYMIIQSYRFLDVADQNQLVLKAPPQHLNQTAASTLTTGSLLVLHDKFEGHDYTNRNLLPPSVEFAQFDVIYSNGDYLVFLDQP